MYYPYVIKEETEDEVKWTFKIKNLNSLANKDDNNGAVIYKPFFLDDISLDFSKIPAIYISGDDLKLMDLRNRKECKCPKTIPCPYKPNNAINNEPQNDPEDDNDDDDDDEDQTPAPTPTPPRPRPNQAANNPPPRPKPNQAANKPPPRPKRRRRPNGS